MFAKIIVDVPSFQTDKPYTYSVPKNLQALLQVGMRVMVPFGKGNRLVEGFVIELFSEAEDVLTKTQQLKEIQETLDISPVVNSELLELSEFMKHKTFGFRISCLQTMIPSLMRANVAKYFVPVDFEAEEVKSIFKNETKLSWKVAEKDGLLKRFANLRKKGLIEVVYEVEKNEKVKMARYVQIHFPKEKYEEILRQTRTSAIKQREFLNVLIRLSEKEIATKTLAKEFGITSATISDARKKKWVTVVEKEVYRNPYKETEIKQTMPLALNEEQKIAKEKVVESMQQDASKIFLLEGITGSGKTEVYLQIIAKALEDGKTAIVLVPEISLTPLMNKRFKERFGDLVAILHSGLSQGEKYDEWRKIERGEARVIVGARSAIFAPVQNIGVIIMDEEHEGTYKQENNPLYHARDMAIWRGNYHRCPVVLGSATPSLESRARAQKKVYELLRLTKRANPNAVLPKVEIVDFRDDFGQTKSKNFTSILLKKVEENLHKGHQTVLMLNRRGYSSFMLCRDCGFVAECPNCTISLTLHMDSHSLRCHYCGHECAIPRNCPNCNSLQLKYFGTGTQQVQEELQTLFPQARVLRMDVDTTRKKGSHEEILKKFEAGEADILLGTQMIAKGLDFENVTLVGVIQADTSLNLPDFRSSEKTFQLLTQVAGRAGRGEKAGEVVIQTFNPEHYAITWSAAQDYEAFYQKEMQMRYLAGYPPYFFTIQVTVSHKEELIAGKKIFEIYQKVAPHLSEESDILGPAPKSIARMKNQYYYQLIIKYKREENLQSALENIVETMQQEALSGLSIVIDNEPMSFI